MTNQQRIIVLLLASINFTHILDFMVMMPLGNQLMPYFKINTQYFSQIVAAYSISAFISGLIAMFFVDRFDRKHILLFGYGGFIVGTFCCGIAPTAFLLLLSRVVAGLFGGIIGAQVLSIVADSFEYEKRATAMGYLFSAFSVASVIGVPLSLFLANRFSWHLPFFFIVGLGLIIIVLVYLKLPNVTSHLSSNGVRETPIQIIKAIIAKRLNITAFLFSGILMLGHFIIIPFLNPFMEFNVGFNEWQRNLVYIIGGLATMISAPIAGKLADKYGKFTIFAIFAIASLIPIYFITQLYVLPYYFVLTLTGIWFVFSSSRNIPAQAIISNVVPPQHRGSFQSFNSCVTSGFVGLSSLLAGAIVKKSPSGRLENYPTVGYLSMLIIASTLILALIVKKQIQQKAV
jgi:MFS transporter, DHA1 family, inner membrane transport protein